MAWGDAFRPGSFGPPLINTYGMLSGLGDTFAKSYDAARQRGFEDQAPQLLSALFAQQPLPTTAPTTTAAATPAEPAKANYNTGGKVPSFLAPTIEQAAAQFGISPQFLTRTAQLESGFNPNASNKSGAKGLLQFMPGTAKAYGLADPFDPNASILAGARLAADNKRTMTAALGREPSDAELYLAHQQGAGGALKLLSNPNARAVDVVGHQAVVQNGGNPNMTAGQFASLWTGKFGAGGPTGPFQPDPYHNGQPLNVELEGFPDLPGAGILPQGFTGASRPAVTPFGGAPAMMPALPQATPQPTQFADAPAAGAQPAEFFIPPGQVPQPPPRPAELGSAPPVVAPQPVQSAPAAVAPQAAAGGVAPPSRALVAALYANPTTRPIAMQIIGSALNPQSQFDFQVVGEQLVRVNKRTGAYEVIPGITKPNVDVHVVNGRVVAVDKSKLTASDVTPSGMPAGFRPLTSPEERRAYGIPDDDKRPYQVGPDGKLATPGGQNINIDNKAETAEAGELGKAAGKSQAEVYQAANAAGATIQSIKRIEALFGQIKTGKLTPGQMNMTAWAKAFGVSDDTLKGLGLDPNLPGTGEALNSMLAHATVGAIGPGGFPANNFSDADRRFLQDVFPKLANRPEANQIIIDAWKRTEELKIEKAKALQQWRKANKGGSFFDFETEWTDKMASRDVFGDLAKKAEKLGAMSGGGSVLDEARAAIAAGAPKDAVIKRLRERGVDPSGL